MDFEGVRPRGGSESVVVTPLGLVGFLSVGLCLLTLVLALVTDRIHMESGEEIRARLEAQGRLPEWAWPKREVPR